MEKQADLTQISSYEQLHDYINGLHSLSNLDERTRLLDQMVAVLHGHYVFTTSNALLKDRDPISRLLELRRQIVSVAGEPMPNWDFYQNELNSSKIQV